VNELLSKNLDKKSNDKYKSSTNLFFKEKPELVFSKGNIKLFYNDFIKIDLSEYKGKVNLVITSPPYL